MAVLSGLWLSWVASVGLRSHNRWAVETIQGFLPALLGGGKQRWTAVQGSSWPMRLGGILPGVSEMGSHNQTC